MLRLFISQNKDGSYIAQGLEQDVTGSGPSVSAALYSLSILMALSENEGGTPKPPAPDYLWDEAGVPMPSRRDPVPESVGLVHPVTCICHGSGWVWRHELPDTGDWNGSADDTKYSCPYQQEATAGDDDD